MKKDAKYWRRVRIRAKKLGADGCSGVPEFYRDCCLEHDIAYRTHKTVDDVSIDRKTADRAIRECIQSKSVFGRFSPMSHWRYAALRVFPGVQKSWDEGPEKYKGL